MRHRIVNIIIVFLVVSIVLWLILDEYANFVIFETTMEYDTEKLGITDIGEKIEDVKEYPKESIVTEYKGYDVTAKLVIPKIELETYILKNFSENALNVSVTKFWGAEPNTVRKYVCSRA